ncbi:hypothetical protein ERJ75_000960200 [Trypanosoma vivax]|uniref:Uncharacterized protein n=1 Tax=Trypanosoma vivax (strain Y486) TaxID=1055687 RepID=G0U4V8_TRYVY|nr:hypothetical protein TRVL_03914 [Trypanosoma vivax]KAH8611581.1 hypothetical protein ERJ75_000960200 [Trypanosoma vivax]CCC52473.1 conserved hypothetical protein [Trypanosoma vivax Y486]
MTGSRQLQTTKHEQSNVQHEIALVRTHRFNWMGHEGTESEVLNVSMLRANNEGALRYNDQIQREIVIASIRQRLEEIKRGLGLLPAENEQGGDGDDEIEDEDEDDEDGEGEHTEAEMLLQLALRRVELDEKARTRGEMGSDIPLHYGTVTDEELSGASAFFSAGCRALLTRTKQTFTSYLDGRNFVSPVALAAHNEQGRVFYEDAVKSVSDGKRELPAVEKFDVEAIQAVVDERDLLRLKIDALRARDGKYAARFIRSLELDDDGNPLAEVDPDDTEEQLNEKLQAVRQVLAQERREYNKRANAAAKRIQAAFVNQAQAGEVY